MRDDRDDALGRFSICKPGEHMPGDLKKFRAIFCEKPYDIPAFFFFDELIGEKDLVDLDARAERHLEDPPSLDDKHVPAVCMGSFPDTDRFFDAWVGRARDPDIFHGNINFNRNSF